MITIYNTRERRAELKSPDPRLAQQMQKRAQRYEELRSLSREALLERVRQLYRVHSVTESTARWDIITMILDAELPVK